MTQINDNEIYKLGAIDGILTKPNFNYFPRKSILKVWETLRNIVLSYAAIDFQEYLIIKNWEKKSSRVGFLEWY